MTWTQPLCIFLLVASAVACSSVKVGYDHDPNVVFDAYHTYAWVTGPQEATGDRRIDNSLVDIRIRIAVGAPLDLKGDTQPVTGEPDFYVADHAGLKDILCGLGE